MSKQATVAGSRVETLSPPRVRWFHLRDDGLIPNSRFPVLLYEGAFQFSAADDAALEVERTFHTNGWGGGWRDSIYTFHHYHSTAHEVLGVNSGWARVKFGGDEGITQQLNRGDVVVIPAGVAHRNLDSSSDFGVVGAYPEGQRWDLCYGRAGERPGADHAIARVPLPQADPIYGPTGPLLQHWGR